MTRSGYAAHGVGLADAFNIFMCARGLAALSKRARSLVVLAFLLKRDPLLQVSEQNFEVGGFQNRVVIIC